MKAEAERMNFKQKDHELPCDLELYKQQHIGGCAYGL
jgi:hypothetical protein